MSEKRLTQVKVGEWVLLCAVGFSEVVKVRKVTNGRLYVEGYEDYVNIITQVWVCGSSL